jgi:hypothetical protein
VTASQRRTAYSDAYPGVRGVPPWDGRGVIRSRTETTGLTGSQRSSVPRKS